MKHSERIGLLMFRYIRHKLNQVEEAELIEWRGLSSANDQFFRDKTDPEDIRKLLMRMPDEDDEMLKRLKTEFPDQFNMTHKTKIRPLHRALRFAAVLIITIGIYCLNMLLPSIKAGGYEATVVSPDGMKDDLNSAWSSVKRGFQVGQAGIVRKTVNGQLIYEAPDYNKSRKDKYYTLFTKRGGEYGLHLADGTMIWVNSATTIQYPANLSQDTIRITINGEAYFEIPESAKHVYQILTANSQLSTINYQLPTVNGQPSPKYDKIQIITKSAQFNLMSYSDEPAPLITFISGKGIIIGNYQPSTINHQPLTTNAQQSIADIIAWKNNQTSYHNADIQTIMRAASRWYDAETIYEGTIPDKKYSVVLSRESDIHDLLSILQKQGGFFSVHGKTINVRY